MSFLARRAMTAAAPRLMAGSAAASAPAPASAPASASASASRAFSASARRDIAKITLIGNLAATPEVKATSTGTDVIEYAIASSDGYGEKRRTSWFRVAAFADEGPRRDFLTSLPKGSTVYVEGDCIMNTYNDAEGKTRTSLSIYQKNIQVLRKPGPPE